MPSTLVRAALGTGFGALLALAGGSCSGRPSEGARHLVLITIDTLRADQIDREVSGIALTPRLSALGARSVTFDAAYSVASETSPGIAAILTGLVPHRSGVVGNRHVLPDSLPALAPLLREAGFETGAFIANPVLGEAYGFGRGFDRYALVAPQPGAAKARAGPVLRAAGEWLGRRPADRRVFLWIHLFEPHGPYRPPAEAVESWPLGAFGPAGEIEVCEPQSDSGFRCLPRYQVEDRAGVATATDLRHYLRNYAGEVRDVDRELGEWLGTPPIADLLERSVLIVTSDHGEALAGDHGFYFVHGVPLAEDQVRVPLLISAPGLAARRVASPVTTVAVLPTALDLLGLAAPSALDGRNLFGAEPSVVSGHGRHDEFLRSGALKLRRPARAPERLALYDVAADPGESVDLAAARPADLQRLLALLDEIRARPPLAVSRRRPRPSEREAEELRSLGYL